MNIKGDKIIIAVTVCVLLLVGLALMFAAGGSGGGGGGAVSDSGASSTAEAISDDYNVFEHDTILDSKKANESEDAQSCEEAVSDFASRGFDTSEITAYFTTEGDFVENATVSSTSSDTYAVYYLLYQSALDETWTIYLCNGCATACPILHSQEVGKEIFICERDSMMAYDSEKNEFVDINPNQSNSILKKINRIDKATLDSLTSDGIDAL